MATTLGVLHDERGALSSKRVAGLAATAALIVALLADVVADVTLADALVWAVTAIALGGLGLSSLDKYSPRAKVGAAVHQERESKAIHAIPET